MRSTNRKKYLVGAYTRLSREDDHRDESSSIESQKMIIESFAKFNNLIISKYYSDDGFTGSNYNRPGFELLKQDIENETINCVIVKDLSRLGRELYETGIYIEEYFLTKNVRFIAINDGYDSLVGDAMLGIRLSVNDLYLRDTSKKIRSTFDVKRKKGDYIASFPKFGYKRNPNNPKRLIPDPISSKYVKQIFEWASSGAGTTVISRRLTEARVPIPSIYSKRYVSKNEELNKGTGIWRPQTVRQILSDKMYLGHMIQGRFRKLSYNSEKIIATDPKEWYVVENTHEALVSVDVFNKVQKALDKNSKFRSKGEKKHLFQGLLVCKDCGHAITIYKKKLKKGITFHGQCEYYRRFSKHGVCCSHSFSYEKLELHLLHYFHEIGKNFMKEFNQENFMKKVLHLKSQENRYIQNRVDELSKDIKKNEKIILKLYEDRLNDIISLGQYTMLIKQYDEKVERLEKEKEALEKTILKKENENEKASFEECREIIEKFVAFKTPTFELIYDLVEKIEIDKEKNIEVFLKVNIENYLSFTEKS